MTKPLYEQPWTVVSPTECEFYHTTDIPGVGVVEGQWDLREGLDEYLGGYDFSGKRVLEIGPATGFLTFHIEKTAREVVAVDLPMDRGFWNFVPYEKLGLTGRKTEERAEVEEQFYGHIDRIRKGFWLCYDKFESRAKVHYGPSEELPEALGEFDVVLLASVLLHTRSPVTLMECCARLVTGSVIVTDLSYPALGDGPVCSLVPSVENEAWDTWWRFSPNFITQYLGVLGFPDNQVTFHQQSAFNNSLDMFTVVASRNS